MFLILMETSGNQGYIFATNRLRENVGASYLTLISCKEWVETEVSKYPKVVLLLASSGKAYLRTECEDAAKAFIGSITLKALKEAPGLDITGAYVEYEEGSIHKAIPQVHRKIASIRSEIPGVHYRFQQIPILDICSSSGLPAYQEIKVGDDTRRLSKVSFFKRNAANCAYDRLEEIFPSLKFPKDIEDLTKQGEWLAVVHADGNGMGQIFMNFEDYAKSTNDEDYIKKLKAFSESLDTCARDACKEALMKIKENDHQVRAIPLIFGGDDLTLLCLGKNAVTFTESYLKAFQDNTKSNEVIKSILPCGATACAGIAVVKPHYPFSVAYDIAEGLVVSAKKVKTKYENKSVSALDFHVVYDSSPTSLESIRRELTIGTDRLYGGPYLIEEQTDKWGKAHSLEKLKSFAKDLNSRNSDGKYKVPSNQTHALREYMFAGSVVAEASYKLSKDKCEGLKDVIGDNLFTCDGENNVSQLIDAMELSQLMGR